MQGSGRSSHFTITAIGVPLTADFLFLRNHSYVFDQGASASLRYCINLVMLAAEIRSSLFASTHLKTAYAKSWQKSITLWR